MPYTLVAHLQLLEIAEKNASSPATGSELLNFYKMLVERYDRCEGAQYAFCLNQVKWRLERQQHLFSLSQRAELDSISMLEKGIDGEQRFRELLHLTIVQKIRQAVDTRGEGNPRFSDLRDKDEIRCFSATVDSALWTVAVRANDDEQSLVRFVGFRIRQNALAEAALPALKQSHPSEDVRIALADAANNILSPPDLATASVVLTQPFARFEQLASGTKLALVAKVRDELVCLSREHEQGFFGHPFDALRVGFAEQRIGDIPQVFTGMDEIQHQAEV